MTNFTCLLLMFPAHPRDPTLQDIERQLAAKEACLPNEPLCEDENAVTLLVRMPDGSRQGRRFSSLTDCRYCLCVQT